MQYLIDKAVKDGAPGIGQVHAMLSDVAHFGGDAAKLPMEARRSKDGAWLGFRSKPRWPTPAHQLNAIAMVEEHLRMITRLVDEFIDDHVDPLLADPERAEREGQIFGTASADPPAADG
jgi:hypothetical protein